MNTVKVIAITVAVVFVGGLISAALLAVYDAGMAAERVVWQAAKVVDDKKADDERIAAQDRVNAAERTYLLTRAAADVQRADLNKAIENEKAAVRSCTAVTRQLRDKLAVVGTHP